MSLPDKNSDPADLSRYAPLAVLVVVGAFGLIVFDPFVTAHLSASLASTLHTIVRITLGAFLYRAMLRAGLLIHLSEPYGITQDPSTNNKGENP